MSGTTKRQSGTPVESQPLRQGILDAFMSGNIGPNAGNNAYNQSYMNSTRQVSAPTASIPVTSYYNPYVGPDANRAIMAAMQRRSAPVNASPNLGGDRAFLDMLNSNLFATGPDLRTFLDPNFYSGVRGGYEDVFSQRREDALAQAKEMSGNLTGTGYAENLGRTVQRSLADENALLTQLLTSLGMAQYGQEQQNVQNNAQRFLQFLMGQSLAGVAPDTIIQSGGAGQLLSPILTGLGYWAGGPLGGFLGGAAGQGANAGG